MTTTPHGQVPEALRPIKRFYNGTDGLSENQSGDWVRYEDHAAELRRLHAYCQELDSQVIRDCMTHAQYPAESVLKDAERWEFRWLNPANNLHVAPSDLGWKTVNSKGMRSEKEVLEDLQAYRYQGKPVYEVRPLLATRALEKPEIRCPVRLANGGDCPRHNLQCGWPDCNKESK